MQKLLCAILCFIWFVKLLPAQAGSLDVTFGDNGMITQLPQSVLNKAYGFAIQPDSKILIGGYALAGSSNEFVLTRLLPNGDPDLNFGVDGIVETSFGTDALCYAVALQADGKILMAGGAATASNGSKDFAILRFLPDGTLDDTFSVDGIQTISFGIGDDIARSILIQPDGNILVSGTSTNGNNSLMAIARFKPDGTPDVSFSSDGKNTLAIGTIFTNGYGMALLPDGKIMLVGAAKFGMADDVALARFLANGTVDPGFGVSGHVVTNLGSDADSGNAIAIQSDGKMLVAGITGANRDFVLLRYLSDGSLDPDFLNQGIVTTDFNGSDDYANSLLIQPDGKILVGGYAYQGALPDFAMARYLPDGIIDTNFGINGIVTTDFGNGGYDYGFPLILQSDGKILQGGYSYFSGHTAFAAARFISGLNVGVLDYSASVVGFIAPNPIIQSANLEFNIPTAGLFKLQLLDQEGRMVQNFFSDKYLESGQQTEALFFSDELPAGWYLLQLTGLGHLWNIKVLKHQE